MVPLAIGTQTNGSVIRPASFCGVYGYKPTFGLISRHLVLQQSRPLDQVGVFARSVEDAALAAEAVMGFDPQDPDTRPRAKPALFLSQAEEPPVTPKFGLCQNAGVGPGGSRDTGSIYRACRRTWANRSVRSNLPEIFNQAHEQHRLIMEADLARSFEPEYREGKDKLSTVLREMIERGREVLAMDYNNAVGTIPALYENFSKIFEWHDAIITPATIGEAPVGLESTGSPFFAPSGPCAGCRRLPYPCCRGLRGCRWVCSWSVPGVMTPGCCAPQNGW